MLLASSVSPTYVHYRDSVPVSAVEPDHRPDKGRGEGGAHIPRESFSPTETRIFIVTRLNAKDKMGKL